jgi:tRNA(Ile)-lysidine synthase
MALFHALASLRAQARFELVAMHFNHGLRGGESDADENLCRDVSAEWQVPFVRGCADVQTMARAQHWSLEDAARRCRFRWLAATARDRELTAVFLGHHADDQAETVLLRLLRGAGARGLAGMRAATTFNDVAFLRPFLHIRRATLLEYLATNDIPSREDASNRDARFTRNWLRHELLPLLARQFGDGVTDRLVQTADILRDAENALAELAAAALRREARRSCLGLLFPTAALEREHRAVQRAIIRAMLDDLCAPEPNPATFEQVERLRQSCVGHAANRDFTLPTPLVAGVAYGHLYVHNRDLERVLERNIEPGVPLALPCGLTLTVTPVARRGPGRSNNGEAWRDVALGAGVVMRQYCRTPSQPLSVRMRRAADRYRPVHGAEKKIKDLLIGARVPQRLKNSVPLIVAGAEVVWLAGWRIAASAAVRKGDTVLRLELQLQ